MPTLSLNRNNFSTSLFVLGPVFLLLLFFAAAKHVQAAASYTVTPNPMNFSAQRNGPVPEPQYFTITNNGTVNNLIVTIGEAVSWLSRSPASVTLGIGQSATVQISITSTNLAVGNYTGNVNFGNTQGAGAKSRDVNITITNTPPPDLNKSASTMSFTGISGDASSTPSSRILTISNVGSSGSNLYYKVQTDQDWCRVNGVNNSSFITGGPLARNQSDNITVTVDDPSNSGSFSCIITISDNGSFPSALDVPDTVTVAYTVNPADVASLTSDNSTCGQINFTWPGASGAASYSIYRNTANTVPASAYATGLMALTFTDSDPSPYGQKFYYWIETVGGSGLKSGTTAASSNPSGGIAVNVCTGPGSILRQYWDDLYPGQNTTWRLYANDTFPASPDQTSLPSLFEAPTNISNVYGTRIIGYVYPPQTGSYTFWVASDNDSDLFLSSTDNAFYKTKIAYISGGAASSREWTKYASQQSSPITLQAGQKYFIEADQVEFSGSDNLAVGWQLPDGTLDRPISGQYLSPWDSAAQCPFAPQTGRTVVQMQGTDIFPIVADQTLNSGKFKATYSVSASVPAGVYKVSLASWHDDAIDETREKYYLRFLDSDGNLVATSTEISDAPFSQNYLSMQVDDALVITSDVVTIQARHSAYPDTSSQSIHAVCAALDEAPPDVDLKVNGSDGPTVPVTNGQDIILSWNNTGASTCAASGTTGWAGSKTPVSSGSENFGPASANGTFRLTCEGPYGSSAYDEVAVTIIPPQPPVAPTSYNTNSPNPLGGPVLCGNVRLVWTDNSNDEDGFYIYRDTDSNPSGAALIYTAPADTTSYDYLAPDSSPYYYFVASFNGGGTSIAVPVDNHPTASVACEANLTGSDMDIDSVSGFNIADIPCSGAYEKTPAAVKFFEEDVLVLRINICNGSGQRLAQDVVASTTLVNLIAPTSGWQAQLCSQSSCSDIIPSESGTAPNQTLAFSGFDVPMGEDWYITFKAELATMSSPVSRFNSRARIIYTKDQAGTQASRLVSIPWLPFYNAEGTVEKQER